jgi:hypothetical protein
MGARYNAIAGQSVERLAALSDGLFAVAMTLLVLDLKVPAGRAIESDQALLAALSELAPRPAPRPRTRLSCFGGGDWPGHASGADKRFKLAVTCRRSEIPSTKSR